MRDLCLISKNTQSKNFSPFHSSIQKNFLEFKGQFLVLLNIRAQSFISLKREETRIFSFILMEHFHFPSKDCSVKTKWIKWLGPMNSQKEDGKLFLKCLYTDLLKNSKSDLIHNSWRPTNFSIRWFWIML